MLPLLIKNKIDKLFVISQYNNFTLKHTKLGPSQFNAVFGLVLNAEGFAALFIKLCILLTSRTPVREINAHNLPSRISHFGDSCPGFWFYNHPALANQNQNQNVIWLRITKSHCVLN